MKLVRNLLLIWLSLVVLNVSGGMSSVEGMRTPVASILVSATSELLGIAVFLLWRKELRRGLRAVFLNFSVFFLFSGITNSTYRLITNLLQVNNALAYLFYYEYHTLTYFLLLSLAVVYFVFNSIFERLKVSQKYFAVIFVVGIAWTSVFYPFIVDPECLYTMQDYRDFKEIRAAVEAYQSDGISNPTIEQIASRVYLNVPRMDNSGNESPATNRESRISEMLPYLHGGNSGLLFFRPLWKRCVWISIISVLFIILFITYQFLADPPEGAYLEKILWCLLFYCLFEGLHFYAFMKVSVWGILGQIFILGWYVSLVLHLALLALFLLRLRFIQSVEGQYYENRLMTDASRITRWRDAFDNWILRNFMNPGELDRRFLIHRRERR